MTVFSKSFPLNLAFRIWDCFLFEGEVFMYRAAVGLLKLFYSQLINANLEECLYVLHHLDWKDNDDDSKAMESILSVPVSSSIRKRIMKIRLRNLEVGVRHAF